MAFVKEKGKNHGLGGPYIWVWGALVACLVTTRGESIGAANLTILKEHLEDLERWEPEEKGDAILHCRMDTTFLEGKRRLTWALSPDFSGVKKAMISALCQTSALRKQGKGPPTFMQRDLQQWLEVME